MGTDPSGEGAICLGGGDAAWCYHYVRLFVLVRSAVSHNGNNRQKSKGERLIKTTVTKITPNSENRLVGKILDKFYLQTILLSITTDSHKNTGHIHITKVNYL